MAKESQELMAKALEEVHVHLFYIHIDCAPASQCIHDILFPFLLPQAEAEMQRKVELIQQIRAMESVPIIRTKFVDLTETGRQGLLSEMSVAEV